MKTDFISSFIGAKKEILSDGRIRLTGYRSNGQTLVVTYRDHHFVDDVQVSRTDCIGRKRKQKLCFNGGRLAIKRGSNLTTISVAELVYQFDRLANGSPVELGEYNHYVRIVDRDEEFSPYTGDICESEQNKAHNALAGRIKKRYGFVCRIPSYAKVYDLLNDRKINTAKFCQYVALGRIQVVHDHLK